MYRLIPVLLLLASAFPVAAGEPVSRLLDADPEGEVVIEIVRGDVKVIGWDRDQVSVEGTRDDRSEAFMVEREGRVITIEDDIRHHGTGRGTDITVMIPRRSSLKASLVSADLEVSGVAGAVRAENVSGGIRGERLGSEVRVESVSGDVELDVAAVRLEAESVSGKVTVRNAEALVRGSVSSVSGTAELETAVSPDGSLDLATISGGIALVLSGEVNARIRAETAPGGDIRNRLNDVEPERAPYVGAESLEIRLGNGGADITASTVSGRITLDRKQAR